MALSPIERLAGLPFFSDAEYLALNPDVAASAMAPRDHLWQHGFGEGRAVFRREHLARAWGKAVRATADAPSPLARRWPPPDGAAMPGLAIAVSSHGDATDVALAEALAEALAAAGLPVARIDETVDPTDAPEDLVVVGPHVFFTQGLGTRWARDGAAERCLLLNTAAMHRPDFARALPFILSARGLLDASPQVAHMFDRTGMPTLHLRLASARRRRWLADDDRDDPLLAALPAAGRALAFDPEAWDARPLDLGFFGRNTARRSRFLQRNAAAFAGRPCFVYAAQPCRDPLDEEVAWRRHPRLAGHVSGQSRLTLMVAEDEFPGFDWQRAIVGAMASGSVVVTDNAYPHPDYRAGVHLFQDDVRHLAELARWLLDEPDGRVAALAARSAAFAVLDGSAAQLAADLTAFLASLPPRGARP